MKNDKILLKRKSIQGAVINNVILKGWKFVILEVFVAGRKVIGVLMEYTYLSNPFFAILRTGVLINYNPQFIYSRL
jgi:hypothetical protein